VDIEIHLGSDSPSYHRGRELAKQFLLSSSKPEDLAKLCEEVVAQVLEEDDASLLASVVYNLAMVAVGLSRALELEEDRDFADDIVEGLWAALSDSPVPPGKADLKLARIEPQGGSPTGPFEAQPPAPEAEAPVEPAVEDE
jgi:hypothetical protein